MMADEKSPQGDDLTKALEARLREERGTQQSRREAPEAGPSGRDRKVAEGQRRTEEPYTFVKWAAGIAVAAGVTAGALYNFSYIGSLKDDLKGALAANVVLKGQYESLQGFMGDFVNMALGDKFKKKGVKPEDMPRLLESVRKSHVTSASYKEACDRFLNAGQYERALEACQKAQAADPFGRRSGATDRIRLAMNEAYEKAIRSYQSDWDEIFTVPESTDTVHTLRSVVSQHGVRGVYGRTAEDVVIAVNVPQYAALGGMKPDSPLTPGMRLAVPSKPKRE